MRERLERRKKKAPQEKQPAAPPLQPAYFDAEQAPRGEESSPEEIEAPIQHEAVSAPEVTARESAEPESSSESAVEPAEGAGGGARGRSRRRRGGRGRGGRGREQAVAQAFAPAAGKGIIPEVAEGEAAAPLVVESETETPEAVAADVEAPEVEAPKTQAPAVPAAIPSAAARPPKGIVVLAIGLPGSGKSSWFKRHNVVPLSTDMLRSLLFDDVREQRFQDLVFSNLRSMLKARLIAKRPTNYVDATNLTPQERSHWIKLAKDYHYEVHAVFFDVPLEVCIDRHQRRDRVVPEDVMRRMAAKLKQPAFDEGFAKITVVRVKKKAED